MKRMRGSLRSAAVAGCVAGALALLGCQTIHDSGTAGALASFEAEEAGRNWVRPREVTYEIGEVQSFTEEIDVDSNQLRETRVFGYPQPGQAANPYVALTAARAVAELQADGILITNYTVTRDSGGGTASVTVQGRPLTLLDLGVVDGERADRERFVVTVTEDPETGEIVTQTRPVDMRTELPTPSVLSSSGLSKGAWIAIDSTVFAVSGIFGGLLLSAGEPGPGIPLAITSAGALVKLIIDIAR